MISSEVQSQTQISLAQTEFSAVFPSDQHLTVSETPTVYRRGAQTVQCSPRLVFTRKVYEHVTKLAKTSNKDREMKVRHCSRPLIAKLCVPQNGSKTIQTNFQFCQFNRFL